MSRFVKPQLILGLVILFCTLLKVGGIPRNDQEDFSCTICSQNEVFRPFRLGIRLGQTTKEENNCPRNTACPLATTGCATFKFNSQCAAKNTDLDRFIPQDVPADGLLVKGCWNEAHNETFKGMLEGCGKFVHYCDTGSLCNMEIPPDPPTEGS